VRPFLLFPLPGPAAPGGWPPSSAGRGPDLTGRAERSVRGRGPTDGPPPGTQTAPGRPTATPDGATGTADDPLLTIDEVIAELRVSRAAFYRWRRQGAGPAVARLPGGGVRVRRSALTAWLRRLEEEDT
jgi:excisionase family DNA binding protein